MARLRTALCATAALGWLVVPAPNVAADPVVADLRAFAATAEAEVERLGRRIWLNEAGGRRDRLVHWLPGENHLSLGIGHVIWYPEGAGEGFHESFPDLLAFLRQRGVRLPTWLTPRTACPGAPAPTSWRRAPIRACTNCIILWPQRWRIRWPI